MIIAGGGGILWAKLFRSLWIWVASNSGTFSFYDISLPYGGVRHVCCVVCYVGCVLDMVFMEQGFCS